MDKPQEAQRAKPPKRSIVKNKNVVERMSVKLVQVQKVQSSTMNSLESQAAAAALTAGSQAYLMSSCSLGEKTLMQRHTPANLLIAELTFCLAI